MWAHCKQQGKSGSIWGGGPGPLRGPPPKRLLPFLPVTRPNCGLIHDIKSLWAVSVIIPFLNATRPRVVRSGDKSRSGCERRAGSGGLGLQDPLRSAQQTQFAKMWVLIATYHFSSGELQLQLKINDVKVNFWKNNFYVNWKFPVCLSGAISRLHKIIYPMTTLIKMGYS